MEYLETIHGATNSRLKKKEWEEAVLAKQDKDSGSRFRFTFIEHKWARLLDLVATTIDVILYILLVAHWTTIIFVRIPRLPFLAFGIKKVQKKVTNP